MSGTALDALATAACAVVRELLASDTTPPSWPLLMHAKARFIEESPTGAVSLSVLMLTMPRLHAAYDAADLLAAADLRAHLEPCLQLVARWAVAHYYEVNATRDRAALFHFALTSPPAGAALAVRDANRTQWLHRRLDTLAFAARVGHLPDAQTLAFLVRRQLATRPAGLDLLTPVPTVAMDECLPEGLPPLTRGSPMRKLHALCALGDQLPPTVHAHLEAALAHLDAWRRETALPPEHALAVMQAARPGHPNLLAALDPHLLRLLVRGLMLIGDEPPDTTDASDIHSYTTSIQI
jgi:hypothetical protein